MRFVNWSFKAAAGCLGKCVTGAYRCRWLPGDGEVGEGRV